MSKAEELSRLYVLPFLDEQYEKYGEHNQMKLSRFDGYDVMSAYEEGYHQAEKDLALTWKDMKLVWSITDEMNDMPEEEFYQEVLNRFNKLKGK